MCTIYLKPAKKYTAGNYGTRKRSGGVSTLICAVLDDRHAEDDEPRLEFWLSVTIYFIY